MIAILCPPTWDSMECISIKHVLGLITQGDYFPNDLLNMYSLIWDFSFCCIHCLHFYPTMQHNGFIKLPCPEHILSYRICNPDRLSSLTSYLLKSPLELPSAGPWVVTQAIWLREVWEGEMGNGGHLSDVVRAELYIPAGRNKGEGRARGRKSSIGDSEAAKDEESKVDLSSLEETPGAVWWRSKRKLCTGRGLLDYVLIPLQEPLGQHPH